MDIKEIIHKILGISGLILFIFIIVIGTDGLLTMIFSKEKNIKTNYECISGYLYEHKKDFNGKGINVQVIKNNNIMRCKNDK
jgi:hypothetical protein